MFATGIDVKSAEELGFTTHEALESVTINAAHAMWLGDQVGSLTPGKKADVILLRATDLNLAPLSDIVGAIVIGAQLPATWTRCSSAARSSSATASSSTIDTERVDQLIVEARDRMYGYDDYAGSGRRRPPPRRGAELGRQRSSSPAPAAGWGPPPSRQLVERGVERSRGRLQGQRARAACARSSRLDADSSTVTADVGSAEDVEAFVARAVDRWGGLDGVFNIAGIGHDEYKPLAGRLERDL